MQNKRPRQEAAGEDSKDGKMEIGGIMVDERFIYACFDGDFDDIETGCQICGEEVTDGADSQRAWWKSYFNQQWEPDCPEEERPLSKREARSVKIGPVMELETVEEEDYEAFLERHWIPGGRIWDDDVPESIMDDDAPESIRESSWEEDGMMQEDVISEFLNSDRQEDGTSCHYIFSVWNLPDEDEEDEDDGLAQSLTVPTQASSSADGGVAQSLTVPQQARSNAENDGVAQSLTVTTQARRSNAAEMDTDMEFLEEMMLETESIRREIQKRLEEEIRDRLARRFQLQVWIEHELLRQQWQNEFEHAEEVERVRIVESEFDGLSEEVVDQFLLSDPPLYSRRPGWIEMDSDSDIGQSLTSDEDGSERLRTS